MAMKLELLGKEMIIPASPTPENCRTLQLSYLDHSFPPTYIATIFFYNIEDHKISEEIISLGLKMSLSESLTRFYPLAGRIAGTSVTCNDEGAIFTEVRANCLLSEFLRNPSPDSLVKIVPLEFITSGEPPETWPLLHVKVTFFRSGGLAIAVCLSHKICDGVSFTTFIHGWAATAKGCADAVIPEFAASTIYPPADHSFRTATPMYEHLDVKKMCVLKRFVFDASKIAELKDRVTSETVQNPTRVEAVTTLIWRCVTKASCSNSSPIRPSAIVHTMDLRRRSQSTYWTQNSIGNLVISFLVKGSPGRLMEIHEITAKLRKTKEEANETIKEILQDYGTSSSFSEKMANLMRNFWSELRGEKDFFTTTSWCRMGFYEADFGWGNPIWVSPGSHTLYKDTTYIILIDTKDGEGIEAWVSLPEQDMPTFEHDEELLAFATPNPSVLI